MKNNVTRVCSSLTATKSVEFFTKLPKAEEETTAAAATMTSCSSFESIPTPPAAIRTNGQNSLDGEVVTGSSSNNAFGTNTLWKDSSCDSSNNAVLKAAVSNDFDSAAASNTSGEHLRRTHAPLREFRVSFNENVEPEANRRSDATAPEDDVVLLCSSNKSFRKKPSLMRTKTKSRLFDPPEETPPRSQTQRTPVKSGKGLSDIEEDDPFLEEDLPEYYRNLKFNILSLIQLLSLIIIVASLVCSLTIESWRRKKILQLVLWKWQLMVLVLISGRLVAGWAIRIAVFFTERNFLLRKRVLYFVYGLRNAVQNCVWLALVLIAWECILDKKVERVTKSNILPYVTKIWVCLLIGTLIWLIKTLLVKVLASSFHVSTFFDRIQESLFNQYVIETLSGPPVIEMEEEEELMIEVEKLQNAGVVIPPDLKANMFPKRGRLIGTPLMGNGGKKDEHTGITIDHLHRLNQKNISAWKMKKLMHIVRQGVFSSAIDEKIQGTTEEDEALVHITSENQAKAAAKKIFFNVSQPGSKYIHLEDLLRFMREEEAIKTLRLFDDCEQKGINKRSLKNWMVNAFRERRALALSLNDTKTAVEKLNYMLNVMVGVMIVVIWLLILKVATTHFFIFLSSQLLLVVFMFGNTCKTSFEAIIFLFVMHPFDVGDRVEVDGVQMVVEEMNILTTVFLKFDNILISIISFSIPTVINIHFSNINIVMNSSLVLTHMPIHSKNPTTFQRVILSSSLNPRIKFRTRTNLVVAQSPGMQKKIIIPNKKGQKLVGVFHDTGSEKLAVLCHGFRSSKESNMMVNLAAALENEGISVFRFDFSGNGESEGEFEYGNYSGETEDLRSVVEYFTGVQRETVAVLGHSKGGSVVLLYASKYHDIGAVVNVCGRYDLKSGLERRLGQNFMEKLNKDGYIDVLTKTGAVNYRVTEKSLLERINTNLHEACLSIDNSCRVLTVHGSADEVIPVDDALEFAKIIPNHELQIIEGADHKYSSHQGELTSVVLRFIKECLQN